jgi:hypothetical protein
LAEVDIGRYKRVIADVLRLRTEVRQTTEAVIAMASPNGMPELGRPSTFASYESGRRRADFVRL